MSDLQNIDFNDLINSKNKNFNSIIEKAFGENGLGVLIISNLPEKFKIYRKKLLYYMN